MVLKSRVVTKKNLIIVVVAAVICVIVVGTAVYFLTRKSPTSKYQELNPPDVDTPRPPSFSILGEFTKAAVVSNGEPCATVGRSILEKNGSAVDALIATMLCDGVHIPQNMGIGGGFFMTLYIKANNTAVVLNAREKAPAKATQDMYNGTEGSQKGALAVAVPGELKGYFEAWKKYGKLNWTDLFEPTIKFCEEGITVNQHLADNVASMETEILANKALSDILVVNNKLVKKGDKITLPKLAKTLRVVATSPLMADELYNGNLTDSFVKDIQDAGGIITKEDMNSYTADWVTPIIAKLSDGLTMYSMPPPGSGVLVGFIMRILDGYLQNANTNVQITQRITEAFKHAYGRRTELGDPKFTNISEVMTELTSDNYITQTRNKISDFMTSQDPTYYGAHYTQVKDHGTANIVVLAPNGDAAVATSTVNLLFGSQFISSSTGIILNDEMDDFSSTYNNYFGVPPSPANYIEPGKRPFSSMCPTVFVDSNGDVQLAIGAAGGTKITTSTTLVSIKSLWYKKNIKEAIDDARFHHQLEPMRFDYEYGTLREVAKGMAEIGHFIHRGGVNATWGSCVTAIARNGPNVIQNNADFRRPGGVDGF